MKQFKDMYRYVLEHGTVKPNRTGVPTIGVFGYTMRFDLSQGFPLVTSKKVPFKLVATELLWFIAGGRNVKQLQEQGNHIWDEWAREDGDLGPVYGAQWRSWVTPVWNDDGSLEGTTTIDQLANVTRTLMEKPQDRRMIVTAWNPGEIADMALPPCHLLFQFNTRWVPIAEGQGFYKLDCLMYQRSCDTFLGVPFNVASYALLTQMMAKVVGMEPGEFIWVGGDVHIYENHVEQVKRYLENPEYCLPRVKLHNDAEKGCQYSMDDFKLEHIELVGYKAHETIKADVAV